MNDQDYIVIKTSYTDGYGAGHAEYDAINLANVTAIKFRDLDQDGAPAVAQVHYTNGHSGRYNGEAARWLWDTINGIRHNGMTPNAVPVEKTAPPRPKPNVTAPISDQDWERIEVEENAKERAEFHGKIARLQGEGG